MYKRLPVILILLLAVFFVYPHIAVAQTHKSFSGVWHMITLKNLLLAQSATLTTVVSTITTTPQVTQPASPFPSSVTISPSTNPTKTSTVTPILSTSTSSDPIKTFIMDEINKYRASQGLSSISTNSETCSFAKTRTGEITANFNHDGFNNRVNNHTLPYAIWSKVTENIAMTSEYKNVVTMWANSPGHAENMRANTPYVCVEQSGNYFAYEGLHT